MTPTAEQRTMGEGFDRLVTIEINGRGVVGQLYADDSPGADNANNSGPSYARVDSPCWGYAETHELLHTLGAEQGGGKKQGRDKDESQPHRKIAI